MSEVTLHRMLVHTVAEAHRHAGHADIVRELIDGSAGLSTSAEMLPGKDLTWWDHHRARLQQVAEQTGHA